MSTNTASIKFFRRHLALAAAVAAVSFTSATLFAAPQPAPLVNPTGTTQAPGTTYQPTGTPSAPKGEGLASLDDRVVASELSSRGITNLLDRYFKVNGISEAEQQSIKTVGALRELINPKTADKIPYGEKLRRVRQIAEGIDSILPTIRDPEQMMNVAGIIIEFGVASDVNSLEYWGEDPVTQAQLKPMTSAVIKLLDAASKTAQSQADDLANKLRGGNDPNANRWERLDNLAHNAAYTKDMSVYFDALATSQKDPARKSMAETAIKDLKDFDNPDSGVQAKIKNMIAKLNMVAGNYAEAKKDFAAVSGIKDITPAPNPFEQYEARYFSVVSDIMAKDLATAQADKAELDKWQTGTFPGLLQDLKLPPAAVAEQVKGISAAGQMLQWRVHVLESDLAKTAAARNKADDAAEAVLNALKKDRPDLTPRIDQQLVNRMRGDQKIDDKVSPSLLLALLKKGLNESYKTDAEKPDPAVMNKGIEAANAIIHRKDRTNLTAQNVGEAQIALAALQDRLGKKVEAINSYLDFAVSDFKTDPKKATESLDRAGYLVFDLKKLAMAPAGLADAYDRFLPIAINPPFNHKELAYPYAEQLRSQKMYKEALAFYRMVPPTSPAAPFAQYKQMIVLEELLDGKQTPAEHKQTVAELTAVAEEVRKLGTNPKDDSDRNHAIRATLVIADLARTEQKDAKRVLEVLQGFDQLVNGLSNGTTKEEIADRAKTKSDLLRAALVVRINAYIGVGQIAEAVQQLQKLLENSSGGEGIDLVRELLGKLDEEYVHADIIHDTKAMQEIAANEALLTGHLVEWSKPPKQTRPEIAKLYYAYALYDARTQRLAGSMATDPAERKKLLNAALDRYHYLESKEMKDRYLAQPEVQDRIKDGKATPEDPDSQVTLGLAFTEFDLGDYKSARDALDVLLLNKKLGTPQAEAKDPKTGENVITDNDLYWEATYKFLKAGEEAYKDDPQKTAVVATNLKNILIRGGIPFRWQDEFDDLKKNLAPNFNPNNIVASPAKPAVPAAPASQPTSPAASAAGN